jgi:hypothetical protein
MWMGGPAAGRAHTFPAKMPNERQDIEFSVSSSTEPKLPNTQHSNNQNDFGSGDDSFSYSSFLRPTKKRTFEFNLSQCDPPTISTAPNFQSEASQPIPNQRIERYQSPYSAIDASRRSILDCIQEQPHCSDNTEGPYCYAEVRALPTATSERFQTYNDKAPIFSDEGLGSNGYNEHSHKSGRDLLVKEFDGDFGSPGYQHLSRTHVNHDDCRQKSPLKASRPQLPGPASLGCDPPAEGTDKTSQCIQRLELPLRTRHLCVSPSDPDFNAFSWEKMLRDLDLDPFTGCDFCREFLSIKIFGVHEFLILDYTARRKLTFDFSLRSVVKVI